MKMYIKGNQLKKVLNTKGSNDEKITPWQEVIMLASISKAQYIGEGDRNNTNLKPF